MSPLNARNKLKANHKGYILFKLGQTKQGPVMHVTKQWPIYKRSTPYFAI